MWSSTLQTLFATTLASAALTGLASGGDLPRVVIASFDDEACISNETGDEMKTFSSDCDLGNGNTLNWSSTDGRDHLQVTNSDGVILYRLRPSNTFREIGPPFAVYNDHFSDAWALTYIQTMSGRTSLSALRVEPEAVCSIPVFDAPAYEVVRRLSMPCGSDFAFVEAPYTVDMSPTAEEPVFVHFSDIADYTCRFQETPTTEADNDEADLRGADRKCIGAGMHGVTVIGYDARDFVQVDWFGDEDSAANLNVGAMTGWLIENRYSTFMEASGTVEWIADSPFIRDEKGAPVAVIIPYLVAFVATGDGSSGQRPRAEIFEARHWRDGHLGYAESRREAFSLVLEAMRPGG
ncbi:MAG: hypothetical protein AAFO77_03030 [Pseudomonadota bacterium]